MLKLFTASLIATALAFAGALPAQAAPKLLKAHCESAFTGDRDGGAVTETDVLLAKGQSKEINTAEGLTFKLSYGNSLAERNVLQLSASGADKAEGALVSLFIDQNFPRRFDLSVGRGFIVCTTR